MTDVPLSKMRLRLWLKLLKVSAGVEAELRRRLRDVHGTTLPRFDVMSALSRNPDGLKMSDLSAFLRVSNGNVTGIVGRLEKDGLVSRDAVPGDRRALRVRLTEAGRAAFAHAARDHEGWIDEMMGDLDTCAARDMGTLLDLVRWTSRVGTMAAEKGGRNV